MSGSESHSGGAPLLREQVRSIVESVVRRRPVHDIHTHLYDPSLGSLLLWGVDDLLTYHYLVAEVFRVVPISEDRFWGMSKREQADLVWRGLFVDRSPVSEACRGVVTTLEKLGLDPGEDSLDRMRGWFAEQAVEDHVDRCLELGRIASVCMTNSPFDDDERPRWLEGIRRDARFRAGLRLDPLILDWRDSAARRKPTRRRTRRRPPPAGSGRVEKKAVACS